MTGFLVLVNGLSTRFFKSSKGLRQGNCLSAYPLILVMESFDIILRRVGEGGFHGWRERCKRSGDFSPSIH